MLPHPARFVVTSPLSLGRVLWWYGEDDLWPAALELPPEAVAGLAVRFAELLADPGLVQEIWPGAPTLDAHLVLGAIEHLERRTRPAVRRHRRSAPLPDVLDVPEDARWRDAALLEVVRILDKRTGTPPGELPWERPRLQGRWATG